jgi:hypothetical protein
MCLETRELLLYASNIKSRANVYDSTSRTWATITHSLATNSIQKPSSFKLTKTTAAT